MATYSYVILVLSGVDNLLKLVDSFYKLKIAHEKGRFQAFLGKKKGNLITPDPSPAWLLSVRIE